MNTSQLPPVTFNPGPSQLTAATMADVARIAHSGLLSTSHRTDRVRGVVRDAVDGLRRAMDVPANYAVVFQPSATAAMDLVVGNLTERTTAHFVHGAFSGRFHRTAVALGRDAIAFESAWDEPVDWRSAALPDDVELVTVTHNETSTGLCWPRAELAGLRDDLGAEGPLLAVDVTSSFGALRMDWTDADVWFGSVQKCLGLPAGLGFVLVGPRAAASARDRSDTLDVPPWRHLATLLDRIAGHQTVETPNVLGIALLAAQTARWDLDEVESALLSRAARLQSAGLPWTPYVTDPAWCSPTVHNLRVDDPTAWRRRAADHGLTLGGGYGPLRDTCIRIANFPAHTDAHLDRLFVALGG